MLWCVDSSCFVCVARYMVLVLQEEEEEEVVIPTEQDSKQDSACFGQQSVSRDRDQVLRQTGHVWTTVDHGKGMNHRHRILRKKILAKRERSA
jgi:hypothetical protein